GVLQPSRQIHEPAALGVDGRSRTGSLGEGFDDTDVVRERPSMKLGIATAEVKPVDVRQITVAERTPEDELGAGRAQQVEILAVVELKGGVVGDTNSHSEGGFAPLPMPPPFDGGGNAAARQRSGDREQSIEIDGPLDRRRQTRSKLGGEDALDRGDEAEVALG